MKMRGNTKSKTIEEIPLEELESQVRVEGMPHTVCVLLIVVILYAYYIYAYYIHRLNKAELNFTQWRFVYQNRVSDSVSHVESLVLYHTAYVRENTICKILKLRWKQNQLFQTGFSNRQL